MTVWLVYEGVFPADSSGNLGPQTWALAPLGRMLCPLLGLAALITGLQISQKRTQPREIRMFYCVFFLGWFLAAQWVEFHRGNEHNRRQAVEYLNSDQTPSGYFGKKNVGVWKIKMDSPDFDYCLFYAGGFGPGVIGVKNGVWVCRYIVIPRDMSLCAFYDTHDPDTYYYDQAPYPKQLNHIKSLDELRVLSEETPFSREEMQRLHKLVYAVWPVSERPPEQVSGFSATWGETLINEYEQTKLRWIQKNGPLWGTKGGGEDPHAPYTLLPEEP